MMFVAPVKFICYLKKRILQSATILIQAGTSHIKQEKRQKKLEVFVQLYCDQGLRDSSLKTINC